MNVEKNIMIGNGISNNISNNSHIDRSSQSKQLIGQLVGPLTRSHKDQISGNYLQEYPTREKRSTLFTIG